jgi:hypothetical protein
MRALLAIASLLTALSVAPAGEASCHFCLDNTVASCSNLDTGGCEDNVTYMAGHMPGHVVETVKETLDGSEPTACGTADVTC